MTSNETVVRTAFEALAQGDVGTMLESVDPNLEWTFLDPSEEDPTPRVCHGRQQLDRWARRGQEGMTLEEVIPYGDNVLVVTRSPGLDSRRAWVADDRNFHVVTMRGGLVTGLRACRSRDEAVRIASEGAALH